MRHVVLGSVAFFGLIAGSAGAADLPAPAAPAYRPPPPVVAYFNWTGGYVGGKVGGLWTNREWDDAGISPGDPFTGQAFGSHSANDWIGGVQAGCDYQFGGGFVIGIQGDYDWTNANGSSVNNLVPAFTNQIQIRSLASGTGRVGYAWDRFLGYV